MTKKELSELQTYTISINPEDEAFVYAVALVENPAHESMYLAFDNDGYQKQIFAVDETKQSVIGAAIIPNKPILRAPNNIVGDWHFVQFTPEDILIMSKEFFKNKFNSEINIGHTEEKINAYFYQSLIVGDEIGQGKINGLELPTGTWVLGAYISDKEVYNKVAKQGFSVEGLFRYLNPDYKEPEDINESDFETQIKRLLDNLKRL
jgi:hypothetical protein